MDKMEDFDKLKELLDDDEWPREYMFKFIIPFEAEPLNSLKNIFDDDAKITHRESNSSNFISFTAVQIMYSSDSIIEIYKEAGKIDNLISL